MYHLTAFAGVSISTANLTVSPDSTVLSARPRSSFGAAAETVTLASLDAVPALFVNVIAYRPKSDSTALRIVNTQRPVAESHFISVRRSAEIGLPSFDLHYERITKHNPLLI